MAAQESIPSDLEEEREEIEIPPFVKTIFLSRDDQFCAKKDPMNVKNRPRNSRFYADSEAVAWIRPMRSVSAMWNCLAISANIGTKIIAQPQSSISLGSSHPNGLHLPKVEADLLQQRTDAYDDDSPTDATMAFFNPIYLQSLSRIAKKKLQRVFWCHGHDPIAVPSRKWPYLKWVPFVFLTWCIFFIKVI